MELLCEVCDRSVIENKSEFIEYMDVLRKKNDESIYKKILLIILTLTNSIKYLMIMSVLIIKKFFSLIRFEFVLAFEKIFTANVKTRYFYNADISNINTFFYYLIFIVLLHKDTHFVISIKRLLTQLATDVI